ncbi:hypothetical protein BCR44DRAFT_376225 [Catenaria anguillulae PL171]|uniref:Uncharacterized protein n=1 Tax=Catenaria anguillulae PL171 TaxID=765915 RepID=A0A1Y2I5T9_9FUNG|nr:hypothetical protein BCR44DRAFT_376225 [Catenaria anguillulae PL171]
MCSVESTFARDVEDALSAAGDGNVKGQYDVEVLATYDAQSLDKAAASAWKFAQTMVLDMVGTPKTRMILLGVDVGGIVAVETVRVWRKLLNMPAVVPAAQRLVIEGVICINSPFFLLHPTLFGLVDRATLGSFAYMFASPSKLHKYPALAGMVSKWEKRASGILPTKTAQAVNAGIGFMSNKLVRDFEALGLASPASSTASSQALPLPFTPTDEFTFPQ